MQLALRAQRFPEPHKDDMSYPFHRTFAALRRQWEISTCGAHFSFVSIGEDNRCIEQLDFISARTQNATERKNEEGINFLRVKTPTQGCLSNHYVFFYLLG